VWCDVSEREWLQEWCGDVSGREIVSEGEL
jgi:hypothetical protein